MPRPKGNTYRQYYSLDPINKYNQCTIVENDKKCDKIVKSDHGSNLASHIKTTHKKLWAKINEESKQQEKQIQVPSTASKTNRTLTSMLNPKVNISMTKEILIKSCVEMCTVNGRPFSIVEDSGFRKIIEPIVQGVGEFTLNRRVIRDEVVCKHKQVTNTITKELEGKLISLKIDGLTHLNRAFLGINIQFITNGKIVLRTLAVAELFDRHTGEYLREVVLQTLSNYKITSDQIYSCTTDNGRNMLKCISLINEINGDETNEDIDVEENAEFDSNIENFKFNTKCIGVRCAAHTLQLAIHPILKDPEMDKVITKARSVVKKLRTPNISILLKNQGLTKPVIDCATRWSSTYEMLASLNDSKMKNFCMDLSKANDDFFISDEMWSNISEAVAALRPANVATKILQKEQLTFGDAYNAWFYLKLELQKVKNSFSRNLLHQVARKEDIFFENDAFISAIFMDPRWNVILNHSLVERAINHIVLISGKMNSILQNDSLEVVEDDTSIHSNSSSDCVESILKSMEKENCVLSPNHDKIRNLLNEFRKQKRISRNINIVEWWEEKKFTNPELFELSKVLLAVPATQVSVERLFSGVKFIMNSSRNRLDDDSLNAVLVVRCNKDLF